MKRKETSREKPDAIDWPAIHQRLEKLRLAVEQGWTPSPEEKKSVLGKRARALAKEPDTKETGETLEIIEFLLAHERYGIEAAYVREVYPLTDLTPVPCTPDYILGIVNVRGQLLSVTDLKKFFDLPEKGLGDLNKVIILKAGAMEFGILADEILGVRTVPLSDLQQTIPTLTGVREEYLRGVASDRTAILDAAKILTDRRIVVNEEVI